MEKPKKKYVSFQEAKVKLARFCAYQERCHQEVLEKMADLGQYGEERDELLLWLIEENYLNEERFAIAFAGGKFRVLGWGKLRIQRELKLRNISDYCIRKALQELEEGPYLETLNQELQKKWNATKTSDARVKAAKVASYLISRGFEPELVWQAIKEN
ncbi:regulatory protein RecX [Bacteroidota bacterium]